MSASSIQRSAYVSPIGADVAASGAHKTVSTATPTGVSLPAGAAPGVVNLVGASSKPAADGLIYNTSVADPLIPGSEAASTPLDWTVQRPVTPPPVQEPPPKPLSQVLLDQLKSIWSAGASAIQVEQVANQLTQPTAIAPSEAPGVLAKEVLTYSPSTIKKNESI